MDIEKLSQLLNPWLAAGTWHTGHPEDDQRFHRALKSAFDEFGIPITSDQLRKAISLGLNDHLVDAKLFASTIGTYAQRGEDIAWYLINQSPTDVLVGRASRGHTSLGR